MFMKIGCATAFLSALCKLALAAPALPSLSTEGLTVSGVSSGAYMAIQLQVAHSATVKGVGIIAGGPYYCAEGRMSRALANCMTPSTTTQPPTPEQQAQTLADMARAGKIDNPGNLREQRVWMFSGGNDHTVARPVMDALEGFYRKMVPASAIRYVKNPDAGHAMISVADDKPNACGSSDPPYINQCQQFDGAGDLLGHLLGPLAPPTPRTPRSQNPAGVVLRFDQRPFVSGKAVDASLADDGYIYVPKPCRSGGCRIHVVFHGCRQNAEEIGMRFIEGAGYNAWADGNRLVVLYPQTISRYGLAMGSWKYLFNPKGCWDWWGYSGAEYHTREALQVRAVMGMVEQLAKPVFR
jgi:poly(3-hydroxybutyrate) depolymerase